MKEEVPFLSNALIPPIVVNTNTKALDVARKRQADAQRERDKLREVTREVNEIKCEMHDIKCMLSQLLNK